MATTATNRYRAPSITPDVESVSLDDFGLDAIREYLIQRGDIVVSNNDDTDGEGESKHGMIISQDDLDRVETLALCGQTMHAREHILDMVSKRIGRRL